MTVAEKARAREVIRSRGRRSAGLYRSARLRRADGLGAQTFGNHVGGPDLARLRERQFGGLPKLMRPPIAGQGLSHGTGDLVNWTTANLERIIGRTLENWMARRPLPERTISMVRDVIRQPRREPSLYAAAEALGAAALEPAPGVVGHAAALLHRAAHEMEERQPRHAAVALAGWEALTCTAGPLATKARRETLWRLSQLLLSQYISTEAEMTLLDRMDAVGLERTPPFEDTLAGSVFGEGDADPVR